MLFCDLAVDFFLLLQNNNFQKDQSGKPSVSNNLDPDQARYIVGPDLGSNCLRGPSADDTSKQRVKRNIYVKCHFKN